MVHNSGAQSSWIPAPGIGGIVSIGSRYAFNYATGLWYNHSGMMDEFRISKIVRSLGWIRTEYNTMVNAFDGGFYTIGMERNANNAPDVTDIPDQTIDEGSSFTTINLNDYVSDVETADADIVWSWAGNTALSVSIVGQVATIGTPYPDWTGMETITFTATDAGLLTDSDTATFTVTASPPPADEGPGGPILVVSVVSNPFTRYFAEILLTEGFNEYKVVDITRVNASMLNSYKAVILGEMPLTTDQVALLTTWVTAGGISLPCDQINNSQDYLV